MIIKEGNDLIFTNPATNKRFGSVKMATADEVSTARREMAAIAPIWAKTPVKERVKALRQLQKLMIDEMDEITAVLNQDSGKSRQDALVELFGTINRLDEYCKHAPRWLRKRRMSSGLQVFKRCYIEQQPHGVVGIIGPWNYPLLLLMAPIFSALLAGNTVIAKPSEVTGATGVMLENLFKRIPALSPYVRFLHGDGMVGAKLVSSKPDLLFLTGSTRTGRIVMREAAETMTPVVCELGGKDPMIVLEDADIEAAAKWGVWGAFFNAGQTCIAVERVYVVKEVYDAFVKAVIEETERLKVGYSPEIQSENDMSCLTFDRQVDIANDHLQDAIDKGAQVVLGGKTDGMFMEPTIVLNVDHSMKLMLDETFGPILPIMKVEDEEHAVQMSNHSIFGLSASVWSQNLDRALLVAHQLEVGSVNINDTITHFGIPRLPFGGVKQSGIGRTHGKKDIMQFTTTRAYTVSKPPMALDLATVLREPGRYKASANIIKMAFGVTPKQRLEPVTEFVEEKEVGRKAGAALVAAGATAVVVSLAKSLLKRR